MSKVPRLDVDTFDCIVLGGRTATGVLANHLKCNSDVTVLMLEAGGKALTREYNPGR
ncbi:MAG: hypothetical protein JKY17_09190 [Magnetovibrio sp.]|nr:hypothetical protein [Magnetovibrio sp.]